MKIIVRGINEETTKAEVKAIIREYCECDSVYTRGFLGNNAVGYLRVVEIYPTGSTSMIGRILFDVDSGAPKFYKVVKRRRVVKTYTLK